MISAYKLEVPHIGIMMPKKVRPFLKWAGGKGRLIQQYQVFFPREGSYNKYFEPFLGGGTVFFNLAPREAVLSDLNSDLINCYKVIKKNVEDLLLAVGEFQKAHSEKFYYKLRDRYNNPGELSDVGRAAALLYLNKAGFNGIYRVNNQGKFNVPFGWLKKLPAFDLENLRAVSGRLRHTKLLNQSFESILNHARKGDFIYFDPPYYPVNETSNFTKYTKLVFLEKEQEKLAEIFRSLDQRGCLVMLSNSDTDFIHKIYSGYDRVTVSVRRSVGAKTATRGAVNELVIRNYKSN